MITPRARLARLACTAIIAACCLFAPLSGLIWPQYNWDMLAYIGIVKSWHSAEVGKGFRMRLERVNHGPGHVMAQHLGIRSGIGADIEEHAAGDALQMPAQEILLARDQPKPALMVDRKAVAAQREIIHRAGEPL
jgi:hypothetical protein